jgi:hypothetical protein
MTQSPPSYNVAGLFRAYYLASGESSPLYGFTNPAYSAAERRSDRISIRGAEADIKAAGRNINGVRVDALVQLLHSCGRLTESCLLKSNRFPFSGCWLAGPGGFLAGSTNLNPAEYRMALRLRQLRSPPASLDVGDAEGGVLCKCNRRVCLTADPMHFFHCLSSQGQYIRRHDHIRDAIIDQIGDAIRPEDPYDIGVEREPLVRAHLPPSPDPPPAPPGGEEAMEVEADNTDARLAEDSYDIAYIDEMQRPNRSQMSIRDLRERNIADKAARQCRGDIGVYTDGSRLLVDVAVGDATAPSYRKPPPPSDEPADPPADASTTRRRPRQRRRHHDDADQPPRAIIRHRTPRPGEEEQVPTFSWRGREQPQALRAIRVGSFWTT